MSPHPRRRQHGADGRPGPDLPGVAWRPEPPPRLRTLRGRGWPHRRLRRRLPGGGAGLDAPGCARRDAGGRKAAGLAGSGPSAAGFRPDADALEGPVPSVGRAAPPPRVRPARRLAGATVRLAAGPHRRPAATDTLLGAGRGAPGAVAPARPDKGIDAAGVDGLGARVAAGAGVDRFGGVLGGEGVGAAAAGQGEEEERALHGPTTVSFVASTRVFRQCPVNHSTPSAGSSLSRSRSWPIGPCSSRTWSPAASKAMTRPFCQRMMVLTFTASLLG